MYKIVLKTFFEITKKMNKRYGDDELKETVFVGSSLYFLIYISILTSSLSACLMGDFYNSTIHIIVCGLIGVFISYYYVYISGNFMRVHSKFYHFLIVILFFIGPFYLEGFISNYVKEKCPMVQGK